MPPESLLTDDRTWDAFDQEVRDFWPMERELLALIAELLHSLVRVTSKAHGAKSIPPQLHIPRPYDGKRGMAGGPPLISMGEMMKQLQLKE